MSCGCSSKFAFQCKGTYCHKNPCTAKDLNKFLTKPKSIRWIPSDGEVILFEEIIPTKLGNNINIDASITAEVSGLSCECKANIPTTAHNVFKLYVNKCKVAQSGFESSKDNSLSNAAIMYSGKAGGNRTVRVTLTAELNVDMCCVSKKATVVSTNINKSCGNFKDAKGVSLRIFIN